MRAVGTSSATILLCCVVAIFEGFDLQSAGVAAPRLGPLFHMTPGQLAWFFSASTFGLMVGAAFGGRLSDRFGRKKVLIGSIAAFGLMSVANGLAPNVEMLLLARFMTGAGLGGALPNLLALVAENTAPGRRSTALAALYGAMPFGGAVASLVSLMGGAADWRIVFLAGGVGPLVMAPILIFALPESRELQQVQAEASDGALHPKSIRHALMGDGRGFRTLLLCAGFFLGLMILYVLLNWLPTLLVGRGLSRPDASWVQVSFNLCGALASVLTGMAMDRRPLSHVVVGCFALAAAALVLLWLAPVSLAVSFMVGGLVGMAILSTQTVLYATAPSVYPTEVRGTGVGAAVVFGRLGSAVGPLVAGSLLTSGVPPQQVLMVLIPIVVAAGVATFVLALLIGAQARFVLAGATVH
jgi:AAHS family 3-hydroxyphenylpropionic acid transporter